MPSTLELMDALIDVAQDKQKKGQFVNAVKDYQEAINFFLTYSKENKLSVELKTGAYCKKNNKQTMDDEDIYTKAYHLFCNIAQCQMEIKSHDAAKKNLEIALSYKPNAYTARALNIKLMIKNPQLLYQAERDLKALLETQLDILQVVEHTLELGSVQFQLKKYEAALSSLEDAQERLEGVSNIWGSQNDEERIALFQQTLSKLEADINEKLPKKNGSQVEAMEVQRYTP